MSGSSSNPDAAAPSPSASPPALKRFRFSQLSPSWLFAGLLTLIVVAGEVFFDALGGYERLAVALGTAIVGEHVFSWMFAGRKGNTLSAYITGNSILVLTKPAAGLLWPFAAGPLLAILSKHALRFRGQHIWNPTNLSFSILLLVAPGSISILSHQWGNDLAVVFVLMALGFLVVGKSRLLHVTGTYVLAFLVLSVPRAWISGQPFLGEIAPITGPVSMLFMFFMITDPKTVLRTKAGRVKVVIFVALAEALIRLGYHWQLAFFEPLLRAPQIFALAIVGPVAKVWELRRAG